MSKKQTVTNPQLFNVSVSTLLIMLTLAIISGSVGYLMGSKGKSTVIVEELPISPSSIPSRGFKGCTKELKICPDGTKVGRTGPYCEFEACPPSNIPLKGECVTGGCSGELCLEAAEAENTVSTCVYKPEYACLQHSACERQANGSCGWTKNDQYNRCMNLYQ